MVYRFGRFSDAAIVAQSTNTRPVVAPQQHAHNADALRNMFAILHNLDAHELAGIASDNNPWALDRLTTFVLKLDDARLDALWALVQARQPERYRYV